MALTNEELCEATAGELSEALSHGNTTSVHIVSALVERAAKIDAAGTDVELRSILALAPDAIEAAQRADDERASGTLRSRLHGIPILVKDNIEAVGLPGTAGSTALLGRPVLCDSPVAARLREAGLIIFGATNLSQWANMRSPYSTSGWSAVGGLTANPFRLDRCAGGSSSGSGAALAARLTPLAVGTETDGSITCPASLNGVVGLKPTVGTLPGEGIVPIAASQDSAGPMARTVLDTAALFEVLVGGSDVVERTMHGARNARIAVATNYMTGHGATDEIFRSAVQKASDAGFEFLNIDVAVPNQSVGADEVTVLLCEMADDLSAFLTRRGGDGPLTLADVIGFEDLHAEIELPHFGHEFLVQSLATGGRNGSSYKDARARNLSWAVEECLSPALSDADCFIAPSYAPAWKNDFVIGGNGGAPGSPVTQAPAIAGWPIATVPMGLVDGLPVGLSIVGRPGSETTLLAVAHMFEQTLGLIEDGTLVPGFRQATRG